jgi:uncharacterized protein
MDQFVIPVPGAGTVSGLLTVPSAAQACFVFGHGAGAGMAHPFMAAASEDLAKRRIATLRYQFPYIERGQRRPDTPKVAHDTVRAAIRVAAERLGELPLFAGGKSFGGRMTSQAQAEAPLPGVRGLIFLGFPLHPAKKPSIERARHLAEIRVPMLFLQGERDALGETAFVQQVVGELGDRATLRLFAGADHSFHVPVRSGRTDQAVLSDVCDALAAWISMH